MRHQSAQDNREFCATRSGSASQFVGDSDPVFFLRNFYRYARLSHEIDGHTEEPINA